MEKNRKDYVTAILTNLFIPGVGYIYAGRTITGIVVLLLWILPLAGSVATIGEVHAAIPGWVGLLAVVGAIDGYTTVKAHNARIETKVESDLVACPHCAEKIQAAAKLCRFCQREIAR